jgi:hypothetical protein
MTMKWLPKYGQQSAPRSTQVYEDFRKEICNDFDVDSTLLNELDLRKEELVAIRTRLRQEIESDGALMGCIRRVEKHHRS